MPQYAYRGLTSDQTAIRAALEASTPSDVVRSAREAGHRVVMLYKLQKTPTPRFIPLMELPNTPLPPVLTGKVARRCGLHVREGFRSLWRSLKHDAAAVKSRQLRRWREYLTGPSDITASAVQDRIPTPPQADLEEIERNKLDSFLKARRVQCDESFVPDEKAFKLVPEFLASVYRIVPYAVEGNTLTCICTDFTNPHTADDIKFMLNMDAEFVRCADTPEENERMIRQLFARLYPDRDDPNIAESLGLTEVEFKRPAVVLEPWDDGRSLPPLPVINKFESSRIEYILAESAALNTSDRTYCSPMLKLAHLILLTTVRKGVDGLRIWCDETGSHVDYAAGSAWEPVDAPPKRLHEPIVLCVAAAAGIDPEQLAPAYAETTWPDGEKRLAVTATTEFTDFGERLEIHWRPA